MLKRALVICLLCLGIATPGKAQSSTVLVFPFENLSEDRNIEWIGEGIAELIVERLHSEASLRVFSRDERLDTYQAKGIHENASISRATAITLGWDSGADSIIIGTFSGTHDDFRIEAHIIDLTLLKSSEPADAAGKLDDVIPLTNTVSLGLLRDLVPGTTAPESDYTSHPPTPTSAFEDYIRGLLTSDPQKAIELFQDAIRLHPQYFSAMFQLGRLLYEEQQFKESNTWLEKLGSSSPDPQQSQFMIGLNHFYLANYSRAVRILSDLPPEYDVLIDLGAALAAKGDPAGALGVWKRASETDPLGSEAYFNAAYVNLARGDADAALRSLDQFFRVQGRDAEALFLLARTYDRLGRIDESQRTMNQATRLSPRIERWVNQPLPKLERLRTIPQVPTVEWTDSRLARRAKGEDAASLLESAQKLIDSQFYGEAIRHLQDIIRVFPKVSDVHLNLAQVYARQKDYDGALQELDVTLRLAPDDLLAQKLKEDMEKQSPQRRNRQ